MLVTYDSTSDDDELGVESGFGCNGVVEVLLERENLARDASLDFIAGTLADEQLGCLISVFRSTMAGVPVGSHASMTADGAVAFLGAADWGLLFGSEELALARHVLRTGRAQVLVIKAMDGVIHVLLEPVAPPPRLFICGEGPDAVPLAQFARDLGWNVVIWASEPRWLSRERFHGFGELSTGTVEELRAAVDASARPAAVVLSHRYERNRDLLGGLLRSKTSYIGVLGPRTRTMRILTDLGYERLFRGLARAHPGAGRSRHRRRDAARNGAFGLGGDPGRLERFERAAAVTAPRSHPNSWSWLGAETQPGEGRVIRRPRS